MVTIACICTGRGQKTHMHVSMRTCILLYFDACMWFEQEFEQSEADAWKQAMHWKKRNLLRMTLVKIWNENPKHV